MTTVRYIGPERYYQISDWAARIGVDAGNTSWSALNDWVVSGLSEDQANYLTSHLRGLFMRDISDHTSDQLLHSSGQLLASMKNDTGIAIPILSTYTEITSCTITLGPTSRPIVVEGRYYFDVTAQGTSGATNVFGMITDEDDLDVGVDVKVLAVNSGAIPFLNLVPRTPPIPALTESKTFRLRGIRTATTGFAGQATNGVDAQASYIAAYAV